VCHFLWLASPLTLTEIRAMLPAGIAADAAEYDERRALAAAAPDLPHAVRLRAGNCACALYLEPPTDGRSEESVLRARYFRDGVPRDVVIRALDRHRRGQPVATLSASPRARREALAGFAAELARTAGTALYLRTFHAAGALPPLDDAAVERRTVSAVRAAPCTWLVEGRAVLVTP
jgi:hypothetical protein